MQVVIKNMTHVTLKRREEKDYVDKKTNEVKKDSCIHSFTENKHYICVKIKTL